MGGINASLLSRFLTASTDISQEPLASIETLPPKLMLQKNRNIITTTKSIYNAINIDMKQGRIAGIYSRRRKEASSSQKRQRLTLDLGLAYSIASLGLIKKKAGESDLRSSFIRTSRALTNTTLKIVMGIIP